MKLTLSAVEKAVKPSEKAAALFRDLNTLADQALQEIRTISHLLHPPLLDEVGFSSAAQWYVEGFSKRSGIHANLQISASVSLSKEAEAVLFRVLQESLTNVLRHSGSEAVDIDFSTNAKDASLCIRDYGKGIPADKLANFRETGAGVGVGLGGMKQRVRELNGQLTVESSGAGTSVTAILPLTKCAPAA
jgi:signal transduction histidine kinase